MYHKTQVPIRFGFMISSTFSEPKGIAMSDIGGATGSGNAFASAQMRNAMAAKGEDNGNVGSLGKTMGFRSSNNAPPPPPTKAVIQDGEATLTTAKSIDNKKSPPPPLPAKPGNLGAAMHGTTPAYETAKPVQGHDTLEMMSLEDFDADIDDTRLSREGLMKGFMPLRDSVLGDMTKAEIGEYNADYITEQFGDDLALAREKVAADKSPPEPREAWRSPIRFLTDNIKWAAISAYVLLGGRI